MEALKERIKIFLTAFQFGMTFFLGIGVSLVTYINKQMELQGLKLFTGLNWDVVIVMHVLMMVLSGSCAIYFIIQADAVNDDLFEVEEGLS